MSDLESLQAQVAALEALVTTLTPAPPPPVAPPVVTPREEPRPVAIYTLAGSDGLPRDRRAVRQLVEALAGAHRVSSPSREIPQAWVPQLRRLAASRAAGRSWREALEELGLRAAGRPHRARASRHS